MSLPAPDREHKKQGRSIGRLTLRHGDETLVVYLKRHYSLPRLRGLLAALLPWGDWSPGFEEWANLERLRREGFPVPGASAAGQFLLPGGRLQGFIAVDELTGMLALHEAIPLAARSLPPADFEAWKRGLASALAALCRSLHGRRFFHKDLYLCHFYVAEADCLCVPGSWAGRMVMIDLHRLGRHRLTWPWWLAKDLGQLLYSSADVEGVTGRDRARFWRAYLGRGGRRRGWLWRWVRWVALTRARNYLGRNRRKPQVPAPPGPGSPLVGEP
jgi:heptose I phosphotransferase